ncbi:hypothetical protein LJC19_04900 [Oxalobacter sp. OttesenSCG-928-P03]|nr:hypothetical protein [Oxalobacter sp. OttesenSCG-928-P03]
MPEKQLTYKTATMQDRLNAAINDHVMLIDDCQHSSTRGTYMVMEIDCLGWAVSSTDGLTKEEAEALISETLYTYEELSEEARKVAIRNFLDSEPPLIDDATGEEIPETEEEVHDSLLDLYTERRYDKYGSLVDHVYE